MIQYYFRYMNPAITCMNDGWFNNVRSNRTASMHTNGSSSAFVIHGNKRYIQTENIYAQEEKNV